MENDLKSVIDIMKSSDWALIEANRCLGCYEPPCRRGCPADIPVPEFIRSIKSGNIAFASKLVRDANPIAAICGAVCPEEVFCQSQCTRAEIDYPINIRELHRYATSREVRSIVGAIGNHGRVAIIGSGPAGLACAIKLAESGIKAVVFERTNRIGGIPSGSIPGFRLKGEEIDLDIGYARKMGVEFKLNEYINEPRELMPGYDAVFLATGLAEGKSSKIPGCDLAEVIPPLRFLEECRLGNADFIGGKRIVVVGGGNVSLDVAAGSMAAGAAGVHLLYRRGPGEMKVWESELDEAIRRGVIIEFLVSPVEYISESGKLKSVRCIRTRLLDKLDESARRTVETVPGTEFILPADLVVEAIGLVSSYAKDVTVKADLTTSVDGLFAGGDWARGEGTIVEAIRDGKLAAAGIAAYLKDIKL